MRGLLFGAVLGVGGLWGQQRAVQPLYEQALQLKEQGEHGAARSLLRTVLRWEPKRADAWVQLGLCEGQLGHSPEQLAAFEKAVEVEPSSAEARYELGLARLLRGDKEGAREQVGALCELDAGRAQRLDLYTALITVNLNSAGCGLAPLPKGIVLVDEGAWPPGVALPTRASGATDTGAARQR